METPLQHPQLIKGLLYQPKLTEIEGYKDWINILRSEYKKEVDKEGLARTMYYWSQEPVRECPWCCKGCAQSTSTKAFSVHLYGIFCAPLEIFPIRSPKPSHMPEAYIRAMSQIQIATKLSYYAIGRVIGLKSIKPSSNDLENLVNNHNLQFTF